MFHYLGLSLKSIFVDSFHARLSRIGCVLNCLVVLSILASPFAALSAQASEPGSPGDAIAPAISPLAQEDQSYPPPLPPTPPLEVSPVITSTEEVQETVIPDAVASPEEEAAAFPPIDSSLEITPTLPVPETVTQTVPLLETAVPPLTYTVEVTPTLPVEQVSLVEAGGGKAVGLGGKLSLKIPPGSLKQAVEVVMRPADSLSFSSPPPSGAPFEILAYRTDNRLEVKKFDQPLEIELSYDEAHLRGDESTLSLVYFDEQKQAWLILPSYVDEEKNVLHATTDHLTVFDVTHADWEAARLPNLQGFQVSSFTGAATYSLPLWTPPGPGGLQPNLELRYNSQVIDNSIAKRTQASWVGMGWSLETGYIERNMRGTPYDTSDDTYSISVGGMDSLLLKREDGYYHTADESFWRIERLDIDGANDRWIARDKTGNTYYFGDTDNSRAMSTVGYTYGENPNPYCIVNMSPWRWSLHTIQNNFGQVLTFNYSEHNEARKMNCGHGIVKTYYPDLWSYPSEIVYPNGKYKVIFDREARNDYKSSWDDQNAKMLYQKYRLAAVRIMNDSQMVRRYNFSYTPNLPIYPYVDWEAGGKTLTLSKVQEYGVGGAASLPATSFNYDGLHLSEANNGYGGKVAFAYDYTPWFDQSTTPKKSLEVTHCGVDPDWPNNPKLTGYEERSAWCDEGNQYLQGEGYLPAPSDLFQPGAEYYLAVGVTNIKPNPITVRLGFNDGIYRTIIQEVVEGVGETKNLGGYITLPSWATTISLHLECSAKCNVKSQVIRLMPSRWRVREKRYYDGIQAESKLFQYRYDEPATNDSVHSAFAATARPYVEPTTEFRGNAMTQEIGPDGRVEWRFFHQDDQRKGRSAVSIVGSEEFQEDFGSWTVNPSYWSSCTGVVLSCGLTLMRGDAAFYLQGGSNWGAIQRQTSNLTDGDMVLAQFMVNGSGTAFFLDVFSGTMMRWGVFVDTAGNLTAAYNDGGGYVYPSLTPTVTFKKDTWYVALLAIDDQKFLARAWERDNPSNGGEYQRTMPANQAWLTRFASVFGTSYLDAYSEGRIYNLVEQQYTVQTWGTTSNPHGQEGSFTGLGISWAEVQQQKTLDFEKDGEYAGKRTSYEYDSYGNLTRKLEAEWDPGASAWRDYRIDISRYYPNTSGVYLVGLPGYTNQYRCPPNLTNGQCSSNYPGTSLPPVDYIESSVWYLYDGHSWFSDPPTAGKPTGKRSQLDRTSSESYYLDEDYVNDDWGNRTQTRVYRAPGTFSVRQTSDPLITYQNYDTTYHTYVESETNAIGQTTSFGYDTNLGLPTSMTGPNGAATTITVDYDDFGRLVEVVRPRDVSQYAPTLKVTYHDEAAKFWIELQQLIEGNSYAKWRKVYNGLGLLVQAQTANAELGEGEKDVIVDYTYDAYGNIIKQSVPYSVPTWNGSGEPYRSPDTGQPYTSTSYDLMNRLVKVHPPDAAETKYYYFDRETWVMDAMNNITKTGYDAWGRVSVVTPAISPLVSYYYNAKDQLVGVTRGGAATTITYDMGGRKTAMSDPDMGSWSYAYDALGSLVRQTDARGKRVCLYYDQINRLAGKHYRTDDSCPSSPSDVSFTYDQPRANYYNVGHRTGMTDATGATQWDYNDRGELVRETRQVAGKGTFVTGWWYDSAGLLDWMQYPGGDDGQPGEQMNYDYHSQLTLDSVEGDLPYLQSASYDAAGRVLGRVLGNQAVVNAYAYYPWTQQGGRLQQMISGVPGVSTSLQNLLYTYDNVGNVLTIQDYKLGSPQTQTFAYDALYRLISAPGSGGKNGAEDYGYGTDTGNLSRKAGIYYYYDNANHKHAVTSLSNGWTYQYDANGNMTQRNIPGSIVTLTYDMENHLTGVSGDVTAAYAYDGDGKRITATQGVTTTVYVGNYYELSVSGGITSTVKYYYAGGSRIAMRQNNDAVKWLLGDHLGSTSVAANADGSLSSRQGYKAWGETRFGSVPTKYQYTGQMNEQSIGLYYYGARWYDASLGRWIQPDIDLPGSPDGKGLDRYAYVANNPVVYNDSSGHCWGVSSAIRGLPSYGTTCNNLDMALEIVKSPNANAGQKAAAGGYFVVEAAAHAGLAIGAAGLACGAVGSCAAAVEAALGIGSSKAIDISSGFGQNVWSMNPFDRGWAIENAIGRGSLLRNLPGFPTIDQFDIDNGIATSIKSLDLGAKSYQDIQMLTSKVQSNVLDLSNFTGARYGGVNITNGMINARQLILEIPLNASAAQLQTLQELQEWAANLINPVDLILQMVK